MKNILFLCCMLLAFSCDKRPEPPANCLTKNQMSEIIADMILMEASLNLQHLNTGMADTSVKISILKNRNVSYTLYSDSYKYYCYEPEDLKSIYENVGLILYNKKQTKTY